MCSQSNTAGVFIRSWVPCVFGVVVLGLYGRAIEFGYTNWDDNRFILHNPLLQSFSAANLRLIFTPGAMRDELLYMPLTYLSYLAEVAAVGLKPVVTHGVNIVLHAANAILVYCVVRTWCRSTCARSRRASRFSGSSASARRSGSSACR